MGFMLRSSFKASLFRHWMCLVKPLLICGVFFPSLLTAQVVYEGGEGAGKGKHIVFVVSDHEYRSEETCPALARILAKHHGFKCTVLFGVDQKGEIEAGASNIQGLEVLEQADAMFIFARFLDLPDSQMKYIVDYLERGGPVIGLRTSSHAFKIKKGKAYERFDFRHAGADYPKGFGHQVLGNTWVGHYGRNHRQGTRIQIVPGQKQHAILRGVGDHAFCHAGAYVGKARKGFTVLTESQPLVSMDPKAAPDSTKPPMPSTWTREYQAKSGKKARVFHSTQGASQDILDPDYRRLIINGVFWSLGLEAEIKPDNRIDFVGGYHPSNFKMSGHLKGVKPGDLQGYDSTIGRGKIMPGKTENTTGKN